MKTKIYTLLLAVTASVGTMFASTKIGDLYYNLDATNQTAEVTYQLELDADNYKGLTTANIPASVEYNSVAYSVTSIGEGAFEGCRSLTSVTIPNSVTSIGEGAFGDCRGLTSVTISNSVTSIGSSAFEGCSSLTSVTIPNSVTSIGDRAFAWCSGLNSIEIPNSVTSIGDEAFYNCTSLPIINNIRYADTYLIEAVDKTLSTYTIKDGTKWIGNYAFSGCSGLTSVTIPNSVTSIGSYAFYQCTGLTSVTIPNSVTSIGDAAFGDCSSLTSVTIPNSVTSIGNYAFEGCSGLTSLTIPNSVTSIGYSAFEGCSGLTSVEIPNSVTSIGSSAFEGCSGLTSVTIYSNSIMGKSYSIYESLRNIFGEQVTEYIIGNSVTSIGEYAFYQCTGLTSVTIPNSVTSIGSSAFYNCSGLTSVTIPNSVTSIGSSAFSGCSGLTSMEAPAGFFDVREDSWPSYTKILNQVTVNGGELTENELLFINRSYKTLQTLDVSGVTNTEFSDEAFKGCYNLQQLVLPEGLQKVSYMMVAGCVNLQSINIPASVEEIEQRAFEDCRSIKSITFGGSSAGAPGRFNAPAASASQLKKIGNWAFYNAHELQNLEIPEGVTEIGDGAFYGCTYLEEMVLPSSVQTIGDNCFALCAKLQKITVNSVMPPSIQAKTFFDVKRQIPVYVPDEAVSAYENDTYWQEFDIQGQSEVPQGIEEISSSLQGGDKGRLILHKGQILILRGEKVYTLTGQEVR